MPAAALAAPVPTTTTTATTATTTATTADQQLPAPSPMRRRTDGVYGQLNAEWDHLTRSATAHQQMTRWATTEPALAGLRQLADLTATTCATTCAANSAAPARSRGDLDRVLAALLRLHHAGDRLAGRAVLQLMLGDTAGIINRTGTHQARTHEEHRLHVISCLWEAISTYPADKSTPSASNRLALDTVKLVTGRADRAERSAGLDDLSDPDDLNDLPAPTHDGTAADERVLLLVHWGARHGHITAAEARLAFDYHSPTQRDHGLRSTDLAAREQLTCAALRQRVSRITRRLTNAARAAATSGDSTLTALAS